MNEFQVFALGDEFDPDAYLASAPLKFDGLWRKGESGRGHPKSSGVFKTLGDGLSIGPNAESGAASDGSESPSVRHAGPAGAPPI